MLSSEDAFLFRAGCVKKGLFSTNWWCSKIDAIFRIITHVREGCKNIFFWYDPQTNPKKS